MKELEELSRTLNELVDIIDVNLNKGFDYETEFIQTSDAKAYFKKIANETKFWQDAYEKQQKEIEELREFIRWYSGMEQSKIDKAFERFKVESLKP